MAAAVLGLTPPHMPFLGKSTFQRNTEWSIFVLSHDEQYISAFASRVITSSVSDRKWLSPFYWHLLYLVYMRNPVTNSHNTKTRYPFLNMLQTV